MNNANLALFSASNDRDPGAMTRYSENAGSSSRRRRRRGGGMFGSSNDRERDAALSIVLTSAATLVQVAYQSKGSPTNVASVVAITVSLFVCFGYQYFSRTTCARAARICSSIALFSAAVAIASLLSLPLHGYLLRCMPYSICFFPSLSLLSALFPCLTCMDPDSDSPPEEEEAEEAPLASAPSPAAAGTAPMETVVQLTTAVDVADEGTVTGEHDEEEGYYCFIS